MTIIGGFFHEESPWSSMWDWTNRRVFGQYSRLDNVSEHRPTNRGISIPSVEFYSGPRYRHLDESSYWNDEWSDSDCEITDINTNSRPRRQRAKRFTNTSSSGRNTRVTPETSHAVQEVIHIDDDDQEQGGTRRKHVKYDLTKSKCASDSENTSVGRASRSHARSMDNCCDDEIVELKEINFGESIINDTCSYAVYDYLKTFLKSTGRQIDAMKGDGNCFFRALSKIIYGSQTFYDDIRQGVVDVLERYPQRFEAFTDGPMQAHITEMRKNKTWATQSEIYAAATLLNRDIYILSPDQNGDTYRWLLFKPLLTYNIDTAACLCYITICHTHGNHYDRITAIGAKCNCGLGPPEMSGVKDSVDLTGEDEIV